MADDTETIAQVEIAIPGYRAVSGIIGQFPMEVIDLDAVAIQLHGLVNDLVTEVRKTGRIH